MPHVSYRAFPTKWFFGADLYSYASHSTIRGYLVPDEFRAHLFENYGFDSADKICFLYDKLQAAQEYFETAELLDWLATSPSYMLILVYSNSRLWTGK